MIKRRTHSVPNLNMASMPDLIFTVLFFFMIASHMRNSSSAVSIETPRGEQLVEPEKKSAVVYLYVGSTPGKPSAATFQVGNRVVPLSGIASAIQAERRRLSLTDRQQMVVCMKIDRSIPMTIVAQVKQALREAQATRIMYEATEGPQK